MVMYKGILHLIFIQVLYLGKEQTYLRSRQLEKHPQHICFAFQRVRDSLNRLVSWCSAARIPYVSIYAHTIDPHLYTISTSIVKSLSSNDSTNTAVSLSLLSLSSCISKLQELVISSSYRTLKNRRELIQAMDGDVLCDVCISVGKNKGMPLQGIPYSIIYSCEMFSLSHVCSTALLDFCSILKNYTRIQQRNGK